MIGSALLLAALAAVTFTFSTLAGTPGTVVNSQDGMGAAAQFDAPRGVAVDRAGNVYVADTRNNTIRKVSPSGEVTTLAGTAGLEGLVNGAGAAARLDEPRGVALDVNGTLYVADSADGTGAAARFYSPFGVAVDRAGNVFVADSFNSTVRKIAPGGIVTTLAGAARSRGNADGTGASARFDQPFGIAADGNGTVYVSDATANTIRKISAAGVVSTLAGQGGSAGSTDGTGTSARFMVPYGIAVDTAGTVFVVDHGNHTIRRVTAEGVVSTLAGTAGSAGSTDGSGAAGRFRYPSGVAVDRDGNVFVADTDNHVIRQISPSGEVTTVGGSGSPGSTDGVGTAARFFNPKGIAAETGGRIYVADRSNHTVRVGAP